MNLKNILENVPIILSENIREDVNINSLVFDSRKIVPNCIFIAISGSISDGHKYIDNAISAGAVAIVCEKIPSVLNSNIAYIVVGNSHKVLGIMASNFYQNPSSILKVIGITGTNGKTSTSTFLYHLFTNLGYKVGLLSTIDVKIADKSITATHTTPDAVSIQKYMREMVEVGCEFCFMEVSSHAIDQYRIEGIHYTGAVFTNITHDHLDYHGTFQNYIYTKKRLFDALPKKSFALVNIDDKNGVVMLQNTGAKKLTFALYQLADYTIKIVENYFDGMMLRIADKDVFVKILGEFNAYNLLSVYAVAKELGISQDEIILGLSKLNAVEGRFQTIISTHHKVKGVIDYAHTPDAVEKLLEEINKFKKSGKIITLIGCGGNRDVEKRPVMASIACQLSDRVLLTSDNPRDEDPIEIIKQMKEGLSIDLAKKSLTIIDRKEAIKTACMLAEPGDYIVLAGKGHEKYQEIKGEKFPFDDTKILENLFIELNL